MAPPTKASYGSQRYKKLSVTLPPELYEKLVAAKEKATWVNSDTMSGFISELLEAVLTKSLYL